MSIRQNCIFSFEDALKLQPISRVERIINTLDLGPVISKLNEIYESKVGPKPYLAFAMLNALIAMRIENLRGLC
jgi:IS5 family transposase